MLFTQTNPSFCAILCSNLHDHRYYCCFLGYIALPSSICHWECQHTGSLISLSLLLYQRGSIPFHKELDALGQKMQLLVSTDNNKCQLHFSFHLQTMGYFICFLINSMKQVKCYHFYHQRIQDSQSNNMTWLAQGDRAGKWQSCLIPTMSSFYCVF